MLWDHTADIGDRGLGLKARPPTPMRIVVGSVPRKSALLDREWPDHDEAQEPT